MKRNHLIYLVPLILLIAACDKYLDVKSNSSLAVPTTLEDLQALMDRTSGMNFLTTSHAEASADNYFLTEGTYNSRGERERNTYTWKPSTKLFVEDWAKTYSAIYNTNLVLEQINKVPKTAANESQWNNVYGTAHFFRAYHFSQLVWTYAKAFDDATASSDLGIVLRLGTDQNVKSVRASVAQSYEQIIKDARESLNYLPSLALVVTRPSGAAANGLLARVFLSKRMYDSALKYADRSLDIKSDLLDYNNPDDVRVQGQVPFKRFNKEIVFLTHMSNDFLIMNPYFAMVDTTLYNSYHNNDLRKQAFFKPDQNYQKFKGTYSGNYSFLFSGITTAEMLLTRAESYAVKGETENAINDLNQLMIKRWDNTVPFEPIVAASAAIAREKILAERRKELTFRGLRWMDIKRLNKEGANIILRRVIGGQTFVLEPNDNRYALPLPKDIIDLTGMPQN